MARRRRRNPTMKMNKWMIGAGVLGALVLLGAGKNIAGPQTSPDSKPPMPGPTPTPAPAVQYANLAAGGKVQINGLGLVSTLSSPTATGWRVERRRPVAFTLRVVNPQATVQPFRFAIRWVRKGRTGTGGEYLLDAEGEGFRYQSPPFNLGANKSFGFRFDNTSGFLTPGYYSAFLKVMSSDEVLVDDRLPVQNWDIEVV